MTEPLKEASNELKPIKISETANRAIEAYLGYQRGIGENVTKQDILEDAVLFFVRAKLPNALHKVFNLTEPPAAPPAPKTRRAKQPQPA